MQQYWFSFCRALHVIFHFIRWLAAAPFPIVMRHSICSRQSSWTWCSPLMYQCKWSSSRPHSGSASNIESHSSIFVPSLAFLNCLHLDCLLTYIVRNELSHLVLFSANKADIQCDGMSYFKQVIAKNITLGQQRVACWGPNRYNSDEIAQHKIMLHQFIALNLHCALLTMPPLLNWIRWSPGTLYYALEMHQFYPIQDIHEQFSHTVTPSVWLWQRLQACSSVPHLLMLGKMGVHLLTASNCQHQLLQGTALWTLLYPCTQLCSTPPPPSDK